MDLKYLQTFRTVVREGSFTKAAEKLNYSQSTITFQIRQLENELNSTLFERIGRRMVLTKAGEQIVPYIDDVLESVNKLHTIKDDLSEYDEDIRIGAAGSLLYCRMPEILRKFIDAAPRAQLYLRGMNCYDIRDELIDGSLDIGIFYRNVGGFEGNLVTTPIETIPLVTVASPEIAKRYPDISESGQRIPLPLITNEPNSVFRQLFESYLRRESIRFDHTIELWSVPTIKVMLKSNVGISCLPEIVVKDELKSGELAKIRSGIDGTKITAVCAYHKNKWVSPLMQKFIDLCSEQARELELERRMPA